MRVVATHFTDPGCPWAYSARPWHAKLDWLFGGQLDWRLVTIGLTESPERYEQRGYTPEKQVAGYRVFSDRFGMPFAFEPKARVAATSRACRAIVAAREQSPQAAQTALRALQFLQFTTAGRLDDDDALRRALRRRRPRRRRASWRGSTARICARPTRPTARRRAAPGAADATSRAARAQTDGPIRYTAPSVIFTRAGRGVTGGRRLPAVRGLRHRPGEPRPAARATRRAGRRGGGAGGVPGRPHDRGGRLGAQDEPRGARSRRHARRARVAGGRRRGAAHAARRRRALACGLRVRRPRPCGT